MRGAKRKLLLILLVLAAAIFLFTGCANLDVSFDKEGAGSAVLTISKESGATEESIRAQLNEVFEGVKIQSQNREVLTLDSLKENEDGFVAEISFKRIRYIEGIGEYNFMAYSDFLKELNKTTLISNWERGKYKNIQNYNQYIYNFNNLADDSRAFSPVTADGVAMTAEEFTAETSAYALEERGMIFTYYIVDFAGLESITFHFDGEIQVVGGKNVELIGKDTVKVKPIQSDVNVTEIGEDGDPVAVNRSVDCYTGYVYFIQNYDFTWVICLVVIVAALGALIGVGIWRGWFKKLWKSSRCRFIRKNYGLYLMMVPALVLLAIFSYAPMTGIVLAFKDFTIDDGIFGSEWAGMNGFKNFYDVLTTPGTSFGMLARNTVILAALKFVFGFLCAILLAILFSYLKNNWFKKTVQTISYFPYFLSWVVVSGIAYIFLAADGGALNQIITMFGGEPIQWYSEPQYWRGILTFTAIWKTVGYSTIIYLAAMTAIDQSLYEAATIDGAGRINQLWHITLPGMFPVIGIQLIFSLGNLVKDDFDQIYTMTGGGNPYLVETTEVIGTVVFKAIGTVSAYGTATAMGLMQSVVALILVLTSNIIVKKIGLQGMF